MLTSARRTSSLSALGTNLEDSNTESQKSFTSGIRKSRNSDDSRARAIAIALHHAMAIGGASEGEDARRPFCSDARLGYRIADPARPLPMRADASFTAVRSPLVPLALSKSHSAPAELQILGYFDEATGTGTGTTATTTTAAEATAMPGMWTCRGCQSDDVSELDVNEDGFYVCNLCGIVDQQQAISLDRQKHCAREDDPTDVADHRMRDADKEAEEATARGHETAIEKKRRLLGSAGGTRLPQSVARRHQLGSAQSRLETQVVRALSERVEGAPAQVAKRNRVIGAMEKCFDWIGKILNNDVRTHMRMQAKRAVRNTFAHATVCTHHACSLNITKRSNYTLALCIMHRCVERLLPVCRAPAATTAQNADDYALARTVAECTPQILTKILERIQQLHEQNSGTGQIGQVTGSVGLLLDWSEERICLQCTDLPDFGGGAGGTGGTGGGGTQTAARAPLQPPLQSPMPPPPSSASRTTTNVTTHTNTNQASAAASLPAMIGNGLPPLLSLPPSALPLAAHATTPFAHHASSDDPDSPTSFGKVASGGSPTDIVWNVRDTLTGAAREANVRADVRCAAMAALSQPDLLNWIRTQNVLPVDVLSVAVLTAATAKLGLEDCTNEILERYCYEHNISPTTARMAAVTMAGLMNVEPAPATGVFGDGIF